MSWNVIFNHKWDDVLYDEVLKYIVLGVNPPSTHAHYRVIMKRLRTYTIHESNPESISYVHNGVLPWHMNRQTKESLLQSNEFVFKVVKESERDSVLKRFFKDPKDIKLNPKTILDGVLRNGFLGVSRRYIQHFLLSNDGVQFIREFKLQSIKPVIKSYRPQYPFELWQMDFIQFDQPTLIHANKGYVYILVIIDIFSKFVYLFPTKTQSELTVANIINKIGLSGDIPKILHSDNGGGFIGNNSLKTVCDSLHIRRIFGAAYSPQTQGFVENKNKYIKRLITNHMIQYKTNTYIDIVDRLAFSINNTKHATTGFTPMQIHRGREVPIRVYNEQLESFDLPEDASVERHVQNEQEFTTTRTNHVRQILQEVGEKREQIQKDKNVSGMYTYRYKTYRVGMKVKIATYQKYKHRDMYYIQPIIILFQNINNPNDRFKPRNPLRKGDQHVSTAKQFKITELKRYELKSEKWYANYICDIHSIVHKNQGDVMYNLRYTNANGDVYKVINFVESLYDRETEFEEFHKNQLVVHSDTLNAQSSSRKSAYGALFVEPNYPNIREHVNEQIPETDEGVPEEPIERIVTKGRKKKQRFRSLTTNNLLA